MLRLSVSRETPCFLATAMAMDQEMKLVAPMSPEIAAPAIGIPSKVMSISWREGMEVPITPTSASAISWSGSYPCWQGRSILVVKRLDPLLNIRL